MIETKNLSIQKDDIALNGIDLTVNDGEVYLLLCGREQCGLIFTDILGGFLDHDGGEILMDSQPVTGVRERPVTIIPRLDDIDDFEPDLRLKDILDLYRRKYGLDGKRTLELLLLFNLFEDDLKRKIRHCSAADLKAFFFSLLLARDHRNIVIHDFVRGEERAFELNVNRALSQLKKEGKAILFLTGDVFYAYRIADRVSFLKNGYLVPSEPIQSKDFEELDAMAVYKKYLS